MTEKQGRQLLIMAARADHLAKLREGKRLSEEEYIAQLNALRREVGLDPLQINPTARPAIVRRPAWQTN
jgi:hypothetical protein